MSLAESYMANIDQAQAQLWDARRKVERLKAEHLIEWGTVILKSGSEYTGWLTRGKGADDAYCAMLRIESDLAHWERLLREEQTGNVTCEVCEKTADLMQKSQPQLSEGQRSNIRGLIEKLAESKSTPEEEQ
jgi:hypothetical protein